MTRTGVCVCVHVRRLDDGVGFRVQPAVPDAVHVDHRPATHNRVQEAMMCIEMPIRVQIQDFVLHFQLQPCPLMSSVKILFSCAEYCCSERAMDTNMQLPLLNLLPQTSRTHDLFLRTQQKRA